MLLGDHAGGLASLTRALQLRDEPQWRPDLLAAQFYNGILSRAEFEQRVASDFGSNNLTTYVAALLEHPDPVQRDPEFVLRVLEERRETFGESRWPFFARAIAKIRLGDWAGALAAFESRFQLPVAMLVTPVSYEFMRALVYSHLDRDGEARRCYERAMVQWNELTGDDAVAWEHSDAMRWRREAEAALAK